MSDIETLEQLLRRRPGLGPKERAAIRGLLEENEKLRADADRVAAACNVEMADLSTRWNAAEARIDAALAVAGEGGSYSKVERMVKALKGEK